MAEKQRLQDAQQLLREKRLTLLRLPTPEGKMTSLYWGHKYNIYTPMTFNPYAKIYCPMLENGYYTYNPDIHSTLTKSMPVSLTTELSQHGQSYVDRNRKKNFFVPTPRANCFA